MENNIRSEERAFTSADLKRTLGKKELYALAFGHVVGSGIFALVGIGIAISGKSAFIGILLSAIFIIVQALPFIIMAGTARFRGGYYSMISAMWGPKFAGFYIVIFFCSNISLAMYAISSAQYLQSIIPSIPITLTASAIMTIFLIANLFGIEGAAKLEVIMDIILAAALTLFIIYGLPNVDYDTLFTEDFMTAGPMGILTCAVLLTWATAGGIDMVNLSAEAKNPTRDLPQVIIVATIGIAIFYAFIAFVAAGVLPISEIADQPLTFVAMAIFSRPLFLFFIIGGALLALTTTLNATFAWVTKPILQACNDGWLPKKLGYVHPKYKTPIPILGLFYIVGMVPILFKFDVGSIAEMAIILSNVIFIFVCLGAAFIPKKMPELWEKSAFHCSNKKLYLNAGLGSLSSLIMLVTMLLEVHIHQAIGMGIITIVAALFAYFRFKSGAVQAEQSYEGF